MTGSTQASQRMWHLGDPYLSQTAVNSQAWTEPGPNSCPQPLPEEIPVPQRLAEAQGP